MTPYLQRTITLDTPDLPSALDELSLWASHFGTLLLENVPLRPNAEILDVACGTGFPLFELANIYGPSCRVVGLDIWTEALQRASSKLRVHALSNVHLIEADAAQMPFEASAFDLIVSNLGLNNFDDPEAVLSECCRVAKPGAQIVLTTNLQGHMREFYDIYRQTLVALDKTERLERLEANEGHRGTKEWVRSLLDSSGFQVLLTVEGSFAMRYLDGTAFLNHTFNKIAFLDGWRAVLDPAEEQEVFAALETNLNILARAQGDLRVTVPMLYVEGVKRET